MSARVSGELTLTLPEGWWLIALEDDATRVAVSGTAGRVLVGCGPFG